MSDGVHTALGLPPVDLLPKPVRADANRQSAVTVDTCSNRELHSRNR